MCYSPLRSVVMCCDVLRCVVVCCSLLMYTEVCCDVLSNKKCLNFDQAHETLTNFFPNQLYVFNFV